MDRKSEYYSANTSLIPSLRYIMYLPRPAISSCSCTEDGLHPREWEGTAGKGELRLSILPDLCLLSRETKGLRNKCGTRQLASEVDNNLEATNSFPPHAPFQMGKRGMINTIYPRGDIRTG